MNTSFLALFRTPVFLLLLLLPLPALSGEVLPTPASGSELVGRLTRELGVTPKQAQGGAGSILKLAGGNLSTADFAKVTSAIPDASSLISAAPVVDGNTPSMLDAGKLLGKALPIYQQFESLGLDSDMIGKYGNIMIDYLKGSGGDTVAGLFRDALPGDLLDSSSGSVMNLLK